MVRASACHAEGRRFEPGRPRPEPDRRSVRGWPESNLKKFWFWSPRPFKIMYYVYYLQSKKQKDHFYVGYTTDLKKRLSQHNTGANQSTKPFLPWKVVFYEAFPNKADAKRREKYLKTTKGRKALKLMLREYLGK